jgi:hypothetical protein
MACTATRAAASNPVRFFSTVIIDMHSKSLLKTFKELAIGCKPDLKFSFSLTVLTIV